MPPVTPSPLPKIAQLVAEARAELTRLGIDIEGKRSEDLLRMAREERNRPRVKRPAGTPIA
jgi:hypothetical protein